MPSLARMSIIYTIGTPYVTSSESIRFPGMFPPLGWCEPGEMGATFGTLTPFSAQAVRSRHINLVDLVYHTDQVQMFPSVKELAKYSIENNKIFPKNLAKAGGILRYLLRRIIND